jgi:hypothetical protein
VDMTTNFPHVLPGLCMISGMSPSNYSLTWNAQDATALDVAVAADEDDD